MSLLLSNNNNQTGCLYYEKIKYQNISWLIFSEHDIKLKGRQTNDRGFITIENVFNYRQPDKLSKVYCKNKQMLYVVIKEFLSRKLQAIKVV